MSFTISDSLHNCFIYTQKNQTLYTDIIETISATNYDEDDESVPVVEDILPSPNRNDIPNSTLNNSSKSIPVAPADKNKNSLQSTNELEGDVIGQVEQVGQQRGNCLHIPRYNQSFRFDF